MRGATRRTWIKLYITGMLHGSVRWELEPAERSTWVDLLLMAGECNRGGRIADNDGEPFPLPYIANHFNIPLTLLERTLNKCETQNRISRDNGVIAITNWDVYQPEYHRQEAYRERQKIKMTEGQKVGMTRSLVNQRPDVAVDVLSYDFGHKVVDKDGKILGG